ncbi:MAG: transcription elongation factor GreA [Patescibacteria group bacterium]|nr:transcription elongation factor GreA [Patescibacteria group bacterium]
MTDKTQYITQGSLDDLRTELDLLKNKKIPEIANRIDEAKQQGDLSENAEYHQAKEDMAWAQGRLLELEQLLSNVQIIEERTSKNGEAVMVGQTVTVEVNGAKKEYTIVGPQEADPFSGKISNESPLGEAFIGRTAGESVAVDTPAGKQVYKILKIT